MFLRLVCTILIFNGLITFLQASGTITGKVADERTGEGLFGVNVVLKGTLTGASTDFDGNFSIHNLLPGTYNLEISSLGYQKLVLNDIRVVSGETTQIGTIRLPETASQLGDVQVSASRVTHTESAVIALMRRSNQIVSGISNEQISKSQDSDAAEVVKRVPGVTVMDNRFIMVRGLSERYNSVSLHDVNAPSVEADIRSFSFDIMPSGLIDRLLIFKTPSPELPGDFAGGAVKIYTRSIPESNGFTVSYGTTYREGSTFGNFLNQEKGKSHWLGFNDGTYNLPDDFPDDLKNVNGPEQSDKLTELGRSLSNNWVPVESVVTPDQSMSMTASLRFNPGKIQIGNITALTYSNSKSINDVKRWDYNIYDYINDRSSPLYEFNDRQYSQQIRVGLLHNWAVRFNNNHSIEFKNLLNQNSSHQYIHRTGENYDFGYLPNNHSFRQIYRGIYSGQLSGAHHIFNESTSINWVGGYGYAYRDEPDYRRYRSDFSDDKSSSTIYVPFGSAQAYFLGRFFSEMKENVYTGNVHVEHQLFHTREHNVTASLFGGMFYEYKDREFTARNLGYARASSAGFDQNLTTVSIDSLFHHDNINSTYGIRIDEQSNPSDSYRANNELKAYFVGTNLGFFKKLNLKTGVRVEDNRQVLESATISGIPVEVDRREVEILPSANLSYNLTDKMLMRLAYGKTTNRPEFRELAPFGFYDFNYNLVRKGNDTISTPQIHNFDLRWEYYPNSGEIISLAAFYKRFNNPIETLFIPGGGSGGIKTFTYANAESATSLGLELEIRKSMSGLTNSKFIDDLSLMFNAAWIASSINLGSHSLLQSVDRPMQGQSPYIINAGLYYNNVTTDFQLSLLYNVIGPRIFIIGFEDYPDIYEMPRHVLDLTVSKGLGKFVELKLGIGDIFNQEYLLLQDAKRDGNLDRDTDQVIQRYNSGRTYSVGVSVKL